MKPTNKITHYNNCIALTIKVIRILKGVKEITVADALCVNRSTYCRKENGITEISIGELHKISDTLNININEILNIAEFWDKNEVSTQYHSDIPKTFINHILIVLKHQNIEAQLERNYKKVKRILQNKFDKHTKI
jgi:transcriptional regulator with XRE-family HTH domain